MFRRLFNSPSARSQGVGVRIQAGISFSILHIVQAGSEAHPASYPVSNRGSFSEIKPQGRKADNSPPTSDVENIWIYTFTPPHAFMA
jgi:hypothetical protein